MKITTKELHNTVIAQSKLIAELSDEMEKYKGLYEFVSDEGKRLKEQVNKLESSRNLISTSS